MQFYITSFLLGLGLTMDAFSVSVANSFNDLKMGIKKITFMSFLFGLFQMLMPLLGWICIHTIANYFNVFIYFIPWIALILLSYIGGKMVYGFFKGEDEEENTKKLTIATLLVQAIATSIDALSVGFTIATYDLNHALITSCIIGITTFIFCIIGALLGKRFGTKFSNKAELIGGLILIGIGIEIFITNMIELFS